MNSDNKICDNCGKIISINARFCSGCGIQLDQIKEGFVETQTVENVDIRGNIFKRYTIICIISIVLFGILSLMFSSKTQGSGDFEEQLGVFAIISTPLMYIFSSIFGISIVKNKSSLSGIAIIFGLISSILMGFLSKSLVGFLIEIVFFITLLCMIFPCLIIADEYKGSITKKFNGIFLYSIVITTILNIIFVLFPIPVLAIFALIILITIITRAKAQQVIILIFIK